MDYSENGLRILNCKDDSAEVLYAKASLLVRKWFSEKYDKGGHPYINHLLYVASCALTDEERVAGLLHDIVEDTEVTFNDLKCFGMSEDVIELLRLLTKDENDTYEEYIAKIISSRNKSALRIKKRDLEHNMDSLRLNDDYLIKKLKDKYEPNYKRIVEALKKEEEL